MDIHDILITLQKLTNEKVTQASIARALKLDPGAIVSRMKRNSDLTITEIEKIQDYFGVKIYERVDKPDICVVINTNERIKDDKILENYEFFGYRLSAIQDELEYLDKDMAKLMNIDEGRYRKIVLGKEDITGKELARLASRVELCLDKLIKG
ncbi:MAG: hypothetical protein LBL38_02405 [Lactobacillales bacterium]|nr:hypothetical protein [Lactobacillales bacterium]